MFRVYVAHCWLEMTLAGVATYSAVEVLVGLQKSESDSDHISLGC